MYDRSVIGKAPFQAAVMVALAFIVVGIWGRSDRPLLGRTLASGEMDSLFGDGSDPCVYSITCETAIKDGASNCAYCDFGFSLKICCNLGTETTCDYSGIEECKDKDRYIGAVHGSYGTCGKCTSTSYAKSGTCTSIKEADGKDCPSTE